MKTRRGKDERSKIIRSLDRITPKIVKLRDAYTCQRCGRLIMSCARHWAHIYRRGHLTLRWVVTNAVTACHDCHRWLDLHPSEKETWFSEKFPIRWGQIRAIYLQPASPVRASDLQVILDENRSELKRLEAEFKCTY